MLFILSFYHLRPCINKLLDRTSTKTAPEANPPPAPTSQISNTASPDLVSVSVHDLSSERSVHDSKNSVHDLTSKHSVLDLNSELTTVPSIIIRSEDTDAKAEPGSLFSTTKTSVTLAALQRPQSGFQCLNMSRLPSVDSTASNMTLVSDTEAAAVLSDMRLNAVSPELSPCPVGVHLSSGGESSPSMLRRVCTIDSDLDSESFQLQPPTLFQPPSSSHQHETRVETPSDDPSFLAPQRRSTSEKRQDLYKLSLRQQMASAHVSHTSRVHSLPHNLDLYAERQQYRVHMPGTKPRATTRGRLVPDEIAEVSQEYMFDERDDSGLPSTSGRNHSTRDSKPQRSEVPPSASVFKVELTLVWIP